MPDDSSHGIADPVRRLMEMVSENRAKLGTTTNPSEITEVKLTEGGRQLRKQPR